MRRGGAGEQGLYPGQAGSDAEIKRLGHSVLWALGPCPWRAITNLYAHKLATLTKLNAILADGFS